MFPDLNHATTGGDDLNDALSMATDYTAGYIYGLIMDKEALPAPSRMSDALIDDALNFLDSNRDEYDEVFGNLVSVDVQEYARVHFEKSVRKTLTIPKWLNDAAIASGVNFSQTLQQALKAQLNLN